MIQILGLRPHFSKTKNIWENTEVFFDRGWRAENVSSLFADLDAHIQHIPENERWNLFYTLAHCIEGRGRRFERLEHIAFDIDGISDFDDDKAHRVAEISCEALGIVPRETIQVNSGNGLHLIIGLKEAITNPEFFDRNKGHYRALLDKIERACRAHGFPDAKADPAIFHKAALMRLPGTENRKPDKTIEKFPGPDEPKFFRRKAVTLLAKDCAPINYILKERSGLPDMVPTDSVSHDFIKKYPHPDTVSVLDGCEFLKHCKNNPDKISEPEWYAMLSIVPHVYGQSPDGMAKARLLAHEYSNTHGGYTPEETDAKIDQAMAASGPRTCKNVNSLWGNCKTCPHFNTTLVSPIMIRGADYIRTEFTGFHAEKITAQGHVVPGKPEYEDLRKFFRREHPYVVLEGSNIVYVWRDTHWEEWPDARLENFAQKHFNPKPTNQMAKEFCGVVFRTHHKSISWFTDSIARRMNFKNGVLNIDTMEFGPHSKEYGFRSVLPYNYDPDARAPRFEKFLDETLGDNDLTKIVLEFAGYAFSNDSCWAQKALILTGVGSNGKSQFIDVMKALAGGPGHYGSLTLGDINKEQNRALIEGKPFNLAEETPSNALVDSANFKNLVTGGEMVIKSVYKKPYSVPNRAKLLMSCNEIPKSSDTTTALYRRMIIIPWNRVFVEGEADHDPFILQKLLAELPGIFNLVIQGYKRLVSQGRFTESSASKAALSEYKESSDIVIPWARETVAITELRTKEEIDASKEFVSSAKLYNDFKWWAEERGYKQMTFDTFSKRFARILGNAEARKCRQRVGEWKEEKREVGYKGVKLLEGNEEF